MKTRHSWLVMLALVLLALPPAVAAETLDVLSLAFVDGPQGVGAPTPDKAIDDFTGPTAFTVDPDGNIYLLDAPRFCVKVFSPDGRPVRTVDYPAATVAGKPVLGIDLAVDARGDLFVANATEGLIWKFDGQGKLVAILGRQENGASLFELLHRLAVDSQGGLLAGEGMTTKVIRLSPDGRKTAVLPEPFYPPVVGPGDELVMVKTGASPNRADVKLCSADQKTVRHLATIEMEKPLLNAAPVGYDARGHLYLFVVVGEFGDNYEAAYVLELDGEGKTCRRVQLPESPGIGMNRYLGVTPDGRILKADADDKTFRIVEYR
ncbi:MAG: hypothetical protein GX442_16560 [Candidatus Riflebacteria bacterium]|nr:hypothetical protein [Candidatus Riflebacteria bacterium]